MKHPLAGAFTACLLLLACAETVPEPRTGPIRLSSGDALASIGNETRTALLLQPSTGPRRFEVPLPPEPVLSFGFGVPNTSTSNAARAARFEIAIESAAGEREVLARRRVDPSRPDDRRWFDARVDLAAWSGQDVALEFRLVVEPGEDASVIGVIGNPIVTSARHVDPRPNVLLVSLDTLRARQVGAYGYERDTTPFLDALAERGVLFENAITTSTTTGPSHMSLFTGRYPVNHGMRSGYETKRPDVVTLPIALHAAGYQAAAFTENGYIIRAKGFGDGFGEYTENRGDKRKGPGEVRVTFGQARRWIEQFARPPFFLFVHTYEVHAPYRPPPEYADRFRGDGLPGPDEERIRLDRNNYDREIRYVDDKVRELIETLEKKGLLDETIVIVLSDHGEEFQEHGFYQHGGTVFEETIRIPVIAVGPGIPAGRRIADQVSLIDVLPTVLELVGQPRPQGADGTSLAAAIAGRSSIPDRVLFAEATAPKRWLRPMQGQTWNPPVYALRTNLEKFIVHRPRDGGPIQPPVRYDLVADPLERSPLVLEGAALARIEAQIRDHLGADAPLMPQPTEAPKDDPELHERLRLLGYLDDSKPSPSEP